MEGMLGLSLGITDLIVLQNGSGGPIPPNPADVEWSNGTQTTWADGTQAEWSAGS